MKPKRLSARVAAGRRVSVSDLADRLLSLCRLARIHPEPEREHVGIPGRRFRFDLAWPAIMLAVEVHGGEFSQGRHTRGRGLAADCEKSNLAQLHGWMILAFTGRQVDRESGDVIATIEKAIEMRSRDV